MNSDWFNLFLHQGKEFIDSVSRKGKNEGNSTPVSSISPGGEIVIKDEGMTEEDPSTNYTQNESGPSSEAPNPGMSGEAMTGAEKEIYETQLEQLQEQLVDLMIENQEMAAELNNLRNGDVAKLNKELEREQFRRKQLEEKFKKTKDEDGTSKLRRRRHKGEKHSSSVDHEHCEERDINNRTDAISQSPEDETVTVEQAGRFKGVQLWISGWYQSLLEQFMLMVWDIISDMSDEEALAESGDVNGPPLAVKRLKDNIRRFGCGIKPISEFFQRVNWVFSWKNPAATMMIFLGYLISVWHGYAISLILFLAIVQLSANFIYSRFGSSSVKDEAEAPVDQSTSWSDKFQVVLNVAQKVQNVLGTLSDYLEKLKNLLTWKVPPITFKLYGVLWILFIMSLALNGQQLFTLTGLFLGYKIFITQPLYKRFPKLQRRYDTTLRLWNELPVHSEVGGGGDVQSSELESQVSTAHPSSSSLVSEELTLNSQLFCERYKLTSDEVFVKGWEEGWRTSLMNKERPLVNIKHGRLYLTQNYLCFERSRVHIEKNILLKLSDIQYVKKYKPLSILPGTGMSIEVCVKDKDEPYIFGAIIGRDEAYTDIIQRGKQAGLSWAA